MSEVLEGLRIDGDDAIRLTRLLTDVERRARAAGITLDDRTVRLLALIRDYATLTRRREAETAASGSFVASSTADAAPSSVMDTRAVARRLGCKERNVRDL